MLQSNGKSSLFSISVSVLFTKLNGAHAMEVIDGLLDMISDSSNQGVRDVAGIALKTIILESSDSFAVYTRKVFSNLVHLLGNVIFLFS